MYNFKLNFITLLCYFIFYRITCTPNLCHVIFCDDEAGLQLADKLVDRGATKLRVYCFNASTRQNLKLRYVYTNMTNSDIIMLL